MGREMAARYNRLPGVTFFAHSRSDFCSSVNSRSGRRSRGNFASGYFHWQILKSGRSEVRVNLQMEAQERHLALLMKPCGLNGSDAVKKTSLSLGEINQNSWSAGKKKIDGLTLIDY